MHTDKQIATASISEVVNWPGGNGLASPPFHMQMGFVGVFGWQHVEQGVEALICDGQVVSRTRFSADWLRTLGRRKFFRRVLLQPAPLTDVSATALTRDRLELTLLVSVKYTVADPAYVASLQDPISELRDMLVGRLVEHIHSKMSIDIIGDEGALRADLKRYLEDAPIMQGHYAVTEVLKALSTGDERLFEVERQKRLVASERGLTELRGENELLASRYEQEIAAGEAQLQDALAERQHARDMEALDAKLKAETDQTLVKALAEIAAAGMDPSKLTPLLSPDRSPTRETPRRLLENSFGSAPDRVSRIGEERTALTSIESSGQIQSFELIGSSDQLKGAIVRMPRCEITLTCKDDYPTQAPEVRVRLKSGRELEPDLIWIPGVSSSLAQAVLGVLPQIPDDEDSPTSKKGHYRLNMTEM